MIKLQVALDLLHINRALQIAELSAKAGADIIEAGTPLIKYNGIKAVKVLKAKIRDKEIMADMKIMDVGAIEAEMAFNAGADIVSVMALASAETIEEAIATARGKNKKVLVDLMNVEDYEKKISEIARLNPDIICFHVGVDVQKRRKTGVEALANELEKYVSEYSFEFAVAGGINELTAPIFAKAGADIIIVGGAITKSDDPYRATLKIKEALKLF
ncbi:MAG: orotidine 5'-phosphate decarboxylase [Thermoproteales archaeon]|nr:orotidine 5'-phosphate decarboxylase [Thermoproteales archaeon]